MHRVFFLILLVILRIDLTNAHAESELPADSIYLVSSQWDDQRNGHHTLSHYRGKPILISMFYAGCMASCPITIDLFRKVDSSLTPEERSKIHLVLATFDSERDTPETLANYAAKRELSGNEWNLIRGNESDTQELAVLLGIKFKKLSDGGFSHSNVALVLDDEGRIVKSFPAVSEQIEPIVTLLQQLASGKEHERK